MTLLKQFLDEECDAQVQRILDEALSTEPIGYKRFEFNRFELTIRGDANEVLIEDVLDAGAQGAEQVALTEFTEVLRRHSESRR